MLYIQFIVRLVTRNMLARLCRRLEFEKKEHEDAIRLGQEKKSAIAEHIFAQKELHEIEWASLTVIDQARGTRERKIREAIHIEQRNPRINRDKGVEKSNTWNAILETTLNNS